MTDDFQFEVPVYTPYLVTNLLSNYLDIRLSLIDRMPTPNKPLYTQIHTQNYREKPLGAGKQTPWPFMSKAPATPITDGKKKARMAEDLHCAAIDLEAALRVLDDEDFQLIYDYYIVGGMTFEELAQSRGLASKGRLHEKMQRIIKRLTRLMNNEGAAHES